MEIESNKKKAEIWNFITQNRIYFTDINDEFKCSICNQLLVNAQLSECTCSFCKECLLDHLKSSNRCLGNNCLEYEINIDTNVTEDFRKNAQIRKLKCKCPTLNCNSEMCIEYLTEHVKLCSVKRCPFVTIGCHFEETNQLNIENHNITSSLNHNKLIVDLMNNFENKITILQGNYRNIEDENKILRDEIEMMKQNHHNDIERVKEEYCDYIDVIKHEYDIKNFNIENKLELDKVEIEQLKKDNYNKIETIHRIENENKNLRNEFENLKKESKKLEIEVKELKIEFIKNVNKNEETFKKENEKIIIDHKEYEQKLKNCENEIKNKEQLIQEIEKTMKDKCDIKLLDDLKNEIRQSPTSIYVWRVDDIIQKREDAKYDESKEVLYSFPFFTKLNGYLLRLFIYPAGLDEKLDTHLSLGVEIMKSKHDEILIWPFSEELEICLINMRTKMSHVSCTFSFETCKEFRNVFDQPTEEFNESLIQGQFVSWTDLLDYKNNLIKDGSIYIRVDIKK